MPAPARESGSCVLPTACSICLLDHSCLRGQKLAALTDPQTKQQTNLSGPQWARYGRVGSSLQALRQRCPPGVRMDLHASGARLKSTNPPACSSQDMKERDFFMHMHLSHEEQGSRLPVKAKGCKCSDFPPSALFHVLPLAVPATMLLSFRGLRCGGGYIRSVESSLSGLANPFTHDANCFASFLLQQLAILSCA